MAETEIQRIGIDYAVKLASAAVDKSDLTFNEKRKLLFSLYSFRCLFDNAEMTYINPLLRKYNCTFSADITAHPAYKANEAEFLNIINDKTFFIPHGGLYVEDKDKHVLRFDVNSELFNHFVNAGVITGDAAAKVEKYSLYETVEIISGLNNATDDLKAMLYIMFPYIVIVGAPHESKLYYKIRERLLTQNVFAAVLQSKYSVTIADSVQELWALDVPNIVIDFYLPYIEYKNFKNEKGVSREVERYQKWLALGRFTDVLQGTEKLLNTFPDDEDLLLTNIAARASLQSAVGDKERNSLLNDTLNIIDAALNGPCAKKAFFLYYYGVCLIGLKQLMPALDKFEECLEINPVFEPALLMKKAITKTLNEKNLS